MMSKPPQVGALNPGLNMDKNIKTFEPTPKCGYGRCTPIWMQIFHRPICLVIILALSAFIQGVVANGIYSSIISTLERRFHFTSKETGLVSIMYDIAMVIVIIPVVHFGRKGHRAHWLGAGMILLGIAAFVCTVPQWATGLYKYGQKADQECNSEAEKADQANEANLRHFLIVFILANSLSGIACSPLYTLGITYIDSNVPQKSSSMYLSIMAAIGVLGTPTGIIVGSQLLRIYGDIGKSELDMQKIEKDLDGPGDQRWYGAWWAGYVIFGMLAILLGLVQLCFAAELPGAKEHRKRDTDQSNKFSDTTEADKENFGDKISHIPKACWLLLKNPTYSALLVMQVALSFLLNGFLTFQPKLIESFFNLNPQEVGPIVAACTCPTGFLGMLFAGFVFRRFKLKCRGMLLFAIIVFVFTALLNFSLLIDCPKVSFAGVTVPYQRDRDLHRQLENKCNVGFNCSNSAYNPVCDHNSTLTFYSPECAGCQAIPGVKTWADCSCRLAANESLSVLRGRCPYYCNLMPVFLVCFCICVFLICAGSIAVQQVLIRSVPYKLRDMSLGLSWLILKLFGSIPGPMTFGGAIDDSCNLWKERCGQRMNCIDYDKEKMRQKVLMIATGIELIIIVSLIVARLLYRQTPISKITPTNEEKQTTQRF